MLGESGTPLGPILETIKRSADRSIRRTREREAELSTPRAEDQRTVVLEAIFLAHHPAFTQSFDDTYMGQPQRRCGRCESAADAVLVALTPGHNDGDVR